MGEKEKITIKGRHLIWCICPDCGYSRYIRIDYPDKPPTGFCKHCAMVHARRKMPRNGKGFLFRGYKFVPVDLDNPFASMRRKSKKAVTRGAIYEHRLVMAQHLGRVLDSKEIVHHLNGIRDDNRIENLILVDSRNHEHETLVLTLQKKIRALEGKCLKL